MCACIFACFCFLRCGPLCLFDAYSCPLPYAALRAIPRGLTCLQASQRRCGHLAQSNLPVFGVASVYIYVTPWTVGPRPNWQGWRLLVRGFCLFCCCCFFFLPRGPFLLLNLLGLFWSQAETSSSGQGEVQEEEAGADEMQLFADDKFDPEFRVATWQQTILGQLITG